MVLLTAVMCHPVGLPSDHADMLLTSYASSDVLDTLMPFHSPLHCTAVILLSLQFGVVVQQFTHHPALRTVHPSAYTVMPFLPPEGTHAGSLA
jgi:hypothetical protein